MKLKDIDGSSFSFDDSLTRYGIKWETDTFMGALEECGDIERISKIANGQRIDNSRKVTGLFDIIASGSALQNIGILVVLTFSIYKSKNL